MLVSTLTSSFEWTSLPARLLRAANRRSLLLTCIASLLSALPAVVLAWETANGLLGPNPLEQLLREPGRWALILLIVVLVATPLRHGLALAMRRTNIRYGRRLSDWDWLLRLRRPVGLASFFYALLHVALYVSLDAGFEWDEWMEDLRSKPFIFAGLAAFILLTPLAVTSTDGWMRRLKRNWKRVHFLIYPAAILAVLHFFWLSKPGIGDPYEYALALGLLLGYRLILRWRRGSRAPESMDALGEAVVNDDRGVAVHERRDFGER